MILVTGATGFVGRRVVALLRREGAPVRALVHTAGREALLEGTGTETVRGDVTRPESLRPAMEGVRRVIHLAATILEGPGGTFEQVNYRGTKAVVEAAAEADVERLVVASVIGATSSPASRYMYSRWMAEQEALRSGIPTAVLRFSVLFGPGDRFLSLLAAQVRLAPLVPIPGDGGALFQPLHVEDAARCLVTACLEGEVPDQVLELGGPQRYSYDGLVDLVAETLGLKIVKVHVPVALMGPVAGVMERLMKRPLVTREQLKLLAVDNVAEPDAVERAFGFAPRPPQGNLDYLRQISWSGALGILMGRWPEGPS